MLRRTLLQSAIAAASTLTAGCSPLGIINALVPADRYVRTRGIAYGSAQRQRLDLYRPAADRGPTPIAVFFYGGNWAMGERGDYLFAGEALASRGITTVIPDYRLYPQVRFPDFLDDCAQAVRWATDHATHDRDPRRVHLLGHSAGAYNAAMLALDGRYLQHVRLRAAELGGWVGLAGPYDFLPFRSRITRDVFGQADPPRATQPIEYASADAPPALLVTGAEDEVVDPGNSARLAERLRARGARVRTIVYPGVGHRTLVGALAAPLRRMAPVLEDIAAFVTRSGMKA